MYFVVRARCRRKESSVRSLSHLLMSFLSITVFAVCSAVTFAFVICSYNKARVHKKFVSEFGYLAAFSNAGG